MITITNVEKSFQGLRVLKGISLSIEDHEIYGIIGQSGAGKSTLLRCINGLETFDAGEINIDGTIVNTKNKKDLRALQKRIGMIFQNFNLLERLDVYDNIALPLKFWGIKPKSKESKERILNLIHLVGLDEKIHAKPKELSGGQKQRVAIARALAKETPIIIADEPTGNLDSRSAQSVMEVLAKVAKDKLV
ncbi:MAG: ATP-binding cassette domain-containing protein, partial [Lachnospiraceae bacterium]|nr:ATP-binding cassette domain-containing protein [Lachnospiraceae bacterium]